MSLRRMWLLTRQTSSRFLRDPLRSLRLWNCQRRVPRLEWDCLRSSPVVSRRLLLLNPLRLGRRYDPSREPQQYRRGNVVPFAVRVSGFLGSGRGHVFQVSELLVSTDAPVQGPLGWPWEDRRPPQAFQRSFPPAKHDLFCLGRFLL